MSKDRLIKALERIANLSYELEGTSASWKYIATRQQAIAREALEQPKPFINIPERISASEIRLSGQQTSIFDNQGDEIPF